jgi:hypothetical protein
MKFTITMKDPDAVDHALNEIPNRSCPAQILDKWFEYREYITVEIDTETGTCTVLENK